MPLNPHALARAGAAPAFVAFIAFLLGGWQFIDAHVIGLLIAGALVALATKNERHGRRYDAFRVGAAIFALGFLGLIRLGMQPV